MSGALAGIIAIVLAWLISSLIYGADQKEREKISEDYKP